MFGRRGLGILWAVVTLLIAAAVGVVAYQAGLAVNVSHVESAAPSGTVVVPPYGYDGYPYWGFGFGLFHLFGFFFFLLFLVFIFRLAFRPRRWGGWGGWGGYGRGPGQGGTPPPFIQERFEEMHRRAHGEGPAPPPADTPAQV